MRLYAEHVRLNQGGYDSHGIYYGQGQKLYRVTSEDGSIDVRLRAPDARTARTRVLHAVEAQQRNPRQVHPETGERFPFREHHIEQHERGFLGAVGQERCASAHQLRLVHFPQSQTWAFKMGQNVVRLHAREAFQWYSTRAAAVAAAGRYGLQVDSRGCVTPTAARMAEFR